MDFPARAVAFRTGLLVAASLLLAACGPPPALIKYTQRGACNGFNHLGGMTNAGPFNAYVIFKVTEIVNTRPGAKDFVFDPERLYVDQTNPTAMVDSDIQIASLNPFALQGRVVKAGTTETFNGAAIAVVKTQNENDPAAAASQTKYALRYSALGSPGAETEDLDPTATSWPDTENCANVNF